ncbi:MAG: hypothetical protein ACLU9T_17790 [Blautia faecis]
MRTAITFWQGEPGETRQLLIIHLWFRFFETRLVLLCELPEESEESETNGEV